MLEHALPVTLDFPRIASPHNPRFKQALKLRQGRARAKQQRILVDGQREITLALAAGVRVDQVFVDESRLHGQELDDWLRGCTTRGVDVVVLTSALMSRLGYGDRHDQCVATAEAPRRSLEDLRLPAHPLLVVLEGVEKPGNLGAVVRSADAAGIDAVIVADGRTDLFNPNAIRASRGTIFTVPLCAARAADVARWLEAEQLQILVARLDASRTYDRYDYCAGTAFVLGNEADGVSELWRDARYAGVKLPLAGSADSLNVAVTAAILCYEAGRQRRAAEDQAAPSRETRD